jgi:dienelactone hydrolase
MKVCCLLICFLVFGATAFAQEKPRYEDLVREFDYDRKAPLDVRETGREKRDGVTIVDLSYASPRGGRVPAYVVVPKGRGPFAAVLFGHWMMDGSPLKNRREFLEEAVALARAGAVSLLIDAPLVRPGFTPEQDEIRAQVQGSEAARQQLIDFRRGVDLLLARRDVDARRIAYVGHSFDAHVGAILAAVEKRIGSFVLMAGNYADEDYVFNPDNPAMLKVRERVGDDKIRAYLREYAWDDPVHYVGRIAPSAVFLQFGSRDEPLPEKWARRNFDMFSEPKKIAFYDAGHALDAEARRDRVRWLAERLRLRPVDEAALARIPELK